MFWLDVIQIVLLLWIVLNTSDIARRLYQSAVDEDDWMSQETKDAIKKYRENSKKLGETIEKFRTGPHRRI